MYRGDSRRQMAVIDMKTIRYINLLDRVSHVRTRKCFMHNETIFFAVGKRNVSKAIGPAASNIKKIQQSVGKKIKIIREPEGLEDAKSFVENIVSPVKFKSFELKDNTFVITAGNNQSKASLIGRNKRRYLELKKILQDFFHKDLKIL